MKNLVSNAIAQITSLFEQLQVKRFFAAVLVGFVLLATNVNPGDNSQVISDRINRVAHQTDSVRPKTTGEWEQEAKEVDSFGERLQNIGEESAAAFKEFGGLYPDTAERSGNDLQNNQGRPSYPQR